MARLRIGRVGLFVLALLAGFIFTLIALYLYIDYRRTVVVERAIRAELGLPEDAFEVEDIEDDRWLTIGLRSVAFLDRNGDTIAASPRVRARLDATSLNGDGPIVFTEAEILRPDLRLVRSAEGDWNLLQIVAVEAGGERVAPRDDEERAKGIAFRNVRIVDGRARIAMPGAAPVPPRTGRFANLRGPESVRSGGRWWTVRRLTDIDARLPLVRAGGAGGWRVEIADASAKVSSPDTRIASLRGWVEDRGDEVIRFALDELKTTYSTLEGAGTIATRGGAPAYDLRLVARPLDFRDLQALGFAVPREGTASFALDLESLSGGRMRWTVEDARVAVLGSRASGRLTAVTAPGADPVFSNTLITLDPVRLADLEALGFIDPQPVGATLTGTVASVGGVEAGRGSLRVDLAAALAPRGGGPESRIRAEGLVRLTSGADRFALAGVRVEADPLHLETLRPFVKGRSARRLRGTVTGGAVLSGTLRDLRIAGGDLAYVVGDAPATRVSGLTGRVSLGGPRARWSLSGRAEPLALATLTELFPALPFRTATLTGPFNVSGDGDNVAFDVDFSGPEGALAARGTLTLGDPLRFDVSGRMTAFRPASVLAADLPTSGALTGTFAARGAANDFRFNVDMTQNGGRFTLAGTARNPGTGMQLDVAGEVENFRVGALIGRPDLLPGPVSGPIRISGGGRQAYRFDVDLRGEQGRFDVEGWYLPGTVPTYAVGGTVQGLDLSGLPGLSMLPRTRLSGTFSLEGRGTTPETFAGKLAFTAAPGSTVAGLPLEAGVARLGGREGVLHFDTLTVALRGARLEARGALGLSRPADVPLTFTFSAPNLAALRPVIPGGDTIPELGGALAASGTVTGTVRQPAIAARGEGRDLRYAGWAAGALTFDIDIAKRGTAWAGRATLAGTDLLLTGTQRLASLDLQASFAPGTSTFSLAARKDANTDVAAAGVLEMEGLKVRGALLDALTIRVNGGEWRLAERARVAWRGDRGLEVENLLLRRQDGTGWIEADGALPPTGTASLRVRAGGIRLAEIRQLWPAFPDAAGVLTLATTIEGPVTDPRLTLDARVDSLTYGGIVTEHLAVTGSYADGRMQLGAHLAHAGREVLEASATLPMTLSLGGIVPTIEIVEEGAVTARIVADSLPLALVTTAVPTLEEGEGVVRAEIDVGGTMDDPDVRGTATLENGGFKVVPLGATWERINASLSMQGDLVRVDSLVARTGDGWARVDGTIRLAEFPRPVLDLRLTSDDFQVAASRDLADLQADADLAFTGPFPGTVLTGSVRVEDGTIYLPELGEQQEADILAPDVGELGADTVTATPSRGAALLASINPQQLTVEIGEGVWLQSPDARIQIGGRLEIDKVGGVVQIYGPLEAQRGTYTLEIGVIRREFDIVSGLVEFTGGPQLNPRLDVVAEHRVPDPNGGADDLVVQVRLTGTLEAPRVQLASGSREPLTESELASLLVFGRPTATAGGVYASLFQGVIVEELLASLLTSQVEETLIRTGIVDFVRVRARPTGGSAFGLFAGRGAGDILSNISIELGRELADNVFLTAQIADIFSGQQQLGASLDWEITRTLSLRAAYEPVRRSPFLLDVASDRSHQASLELRRRWEYGRPPRMDIVVPKPPRREPAPGQPSTPTGEPPPPPPPETAPP